MALVAIAGVVVYLARGRDDSKPASSQPSGSAIASASRAPARDDAPLPGWFGVRGAKRQIAGRVTFQGAPAAGAEVTLQSQLTRAGVRAPETIITGPDGTFDFGARPIALYQVTAEAPDRVPAIQQVDLADGATKSEALELRLHACAASISGTVFDASGGPIAKARVTLDGLAGVVADEQGNYKLCLPAGQAAVFYAADGYGSVALGFDVWGELRQDVVLVPEGVIVVRVLRAEDNAPVPDAYVSAFPHEWARDRPAGSDAVTDREGRARIGRLVPGRYRIFGYADGMVAESQLVALAEVGTNPEVVLRLVATARVAGKVMAGTAPVANAQVTAIRTSPAGRSRPATSAVDGSFVVERVLVGENVFTAFPYAVTSPTQFDVAAAKAYDGVVLQVEKQGSIRGRVTRDGKPVENSSVCCVQTAEFQPTHFTDADGRYEFTGVTAGTYEIGGGTDEAFAFAKKITVAQGADVVHDFELDQAGAISGTVVDNDGKPVAGVFVLWTHEKTGDVGRCATDTRGKYRCASLSGGGKYHAAVYPPSSRAAPFPTADGAPYPAVDVKDAATQIEGATIAIDYRRLAISGKVVDSNGAAIADAQVKALAIGGEQAPVFNSWQRLSSTFTGEDGSFTLAELVRGSYALQARSADGGEGIAQNIAAGAKGVTITIARPGTIEGKLVGFPAAPIIYARAHESERLTPGVVDGNRSFRIAGLRPGRYLVGAQTTFEGDAKVVELEPGETVHVELTARGRGAVDGTVLDFRTKQPIANAACHAVMAAGGEHSITNWDPSSAPRSDGTGRVVIDPAPAGTIGVTCVMSSFRLSMPSADVTVVAGQRATVTLYSAETTEENGSTMGVEFDDQVVAPRIVRVTPKRSGAKAGLLAGDLITSVGGLRVEGLNGAGVSNLLDSAPVGSTVAVGILRGTTAKTIDVVVLPQTN